MSQQYLESKFQPVAKELRNIILSHTTRHTFESRFAEASIDERFARVEWLRLQRGISKARKFDFEISTVIIATASSPRHSCRVSFVWRLPARALVFSSFSPGQLSSPRRGGDCSTRPTLHNVEEAWRVHARRFASAKKRLHSCHCADRDAAPPRQTLFSKAPPVRLCRPWNKVNRRSRGIEESEEKSERLSKSDGRESLRCWLLLVMFRWELAGSDFDHWRGQCSVDERLLPGPSFHVRRVVFSSVKLKSYVSYPRSRDKHTNVSSYGEKKFLFVENYTDAKIIECNVYTPPFWSHSRKYELSHKYFAQAWMVLRNCWNSYTCWFAISSFLRSRS